MHQIFIALMEVMCCTKSKGFIRQCRSAR